MLANNERPLTTVEQNSKISYSSVRHTQCEQQRVFLIIFVVVVVVVVVVSQV